MTKPNPRCSIWTRRFARAFGSAVCYQTNLRSGRGQIRPCSLKGTGYFESTEERGSTGCGTMMGMHRRWFVLCAARCGLQISEPKLGDAAIRTLLEKTAQIYGAAARCRVDARLTFQSDVELGIEQNISLSRSGAQFRVRVRHVRDSEYVIGRERAWEYHLDQREFIEVSLSEPRGEQIRNIAEQYFVRLAGRFTTLPKLDCTAQFVRWAPIRARRTIRRCTEVLLRPKGLDEWFERLWIEADTGLVWRTQMVRSAPRRLTTTIWDRIEMGEPPEPEFFEFHAPKGVRRVEHFSAYQGRGSP